MRLGIRAKLFIISIGLIVSCVVVVYLYLRPQLQGELTARIREDLLVRANLVARRVQSEAYSLQDSKRWDALADDLGHRAAARVTIIAADGVVLGDSEVPSNALARLENHRGRPEVETALLGEVGQVRRHSDTVKREMMYVAVPLPEQMGKPRVARLALPLTEVDAVLARLRHTLTIATVLAMALAVVMSSIAAQLASRTARSLTVTARRMAEGDLAVRTTAEGSDEFAELGRTLDYLARSLSNSLEALRDERDRLRGILAGMQEGVLFLDREGRIALVNPALREMLLLGADAVGQTLLAVIRHAELKELLDHAQHSQEPLTSEIELSGLKPRRVFVRAARLQGEQEGVFAVFVDVTDMRRLESMRRDFVANVSHELRTPVTAIRSAAETLEVAATNDATAVSQFMGIITRNAERLQHLVEDLLDLSRIESQKYQLDYEPLDVGGVFSHVYGLFREQARQRGVELKHTVPGDLARVRADRRALEHVLTNLVENAVKYAGEGAKVELKASETGNLVRIGVEDNGRGIESKHLPRLFERFYRVDRGRARDQGGTGLGLSIVKHLVESMGGNVRVESEPGAFTSFSFSLAKWDEEQEEESDTGRRSSARLRVG